MLSKKLIQAASGSAGGGGLGIEDVFSAWLYTGNSSTQTITNGIDLAGEGGLVWTKNRQNAVSHALYDTERGATKFLNSNATTAEITGSTSLTSFNSDGFTLGADGVYGYSNFVGYGNYASWTFRKAPGFFDVVTYTGNGSTQNIAHNLGSAPGCIIIKQTNNFGNWAVYHRSRGTAEIGILSSEIPFQPTASYFTSVSDTVFAITDAGDINASGGTYVAYLFAHDEQIFGEGGDQSVIKCGSYTGNGSTTGPVIDLGWEPQWILIKAASAFGSWLLFDSMRGIVTNGNDAYLLPNDASTENVSNKYLNLNSTGFWIRNSSGAVNASGQSYIYIAIRRGPMKTPTSGTEVFGLSARTGTGANATVAGGQLIDLVVIKNRGYAVAGTPLWAARLAGVNYLTSTSTAAEVAADTTILQSNPWDVMDGVKVGTTSVRTNASGITFINYLFRRAPGFFDVVAYNGNSNTAQNVSHNLGVQPELMIFKTRSGGINDWFVYHKDLGVTKFVNLNYSVAATTSTNWLNNTAPTSSVFSLGTYEANWQTYPHIAYLFASCPGVSKVFSFTGNGTSQAINCGFAAGARFVLLKRTDSAGNWLVADTARGIISGNDPLLYLNSAAAEITTLDWIDPHSSGFIVNQEATANANVGGATYIGLAIA